MTGKRLPRSTWVTMPSSSQALAAAQGELVPRTDSELVEVVNQKWYGREWWAARCRKCKTWLTKYDHSEAEAREFGLSALARHRCEP